MPEPEWPAYRIYAYRAIPAVFGKASDSPQILGEEELFEHYSRFEELPPEGNLSGFDRLGLDVVQYSNYITWGCSPLTCNNQSFRFAVNRYHLIETVEVAMDAARCFAQEEPEPGPYIIVEVLREREAAHTNGQRSA